MTRTEPRLSVDAKELGNAATHLVIAHEKLKLAISSLERATGIDFLEEVTAALSGEWAAQ